MSPKGTRFRRGSVWVGFGEGGLAPATRDLGMYHISSPVPVGAGANIILERL